MVALTEETAVVETAAKSEQSQAPVLPEWIRQSSPNVQAAWRSLQRAKAEAIRANRAYSHRLAGKDKPEPPSAIVPTTARTVLVGDTSVMEPVKPDIPGMRSAVPPEPIRFGRFIDGGETVGVYDRQSGRHYPFEDGETAKFIGQELWVVLSNGRLVSVPEWLEQRLQPEVA